MKFDDDIVEWHKQTFPKCTFESQLAKLEEEIREYDAVKNREYKCIEELADVYIVAVVLKERFHSRIGERIYSQVAPMVKLLSYRPVKLKMRINRERKWNYDNGIYRHTDDKS